MKGKTVVLGSLQVSLEEATEFSLDDLRAWVVWQFPRLRGGWLCGAAHPSEPGYGWIPARIQPQRRRVLLYAHCSQPHATPEEACEWAANLKDE